jgi:hypothetical protein
MVEAVGLLARHILTALLSMQAQRNTSGFGRRPHICAYVLISVPKTVPRNVRRFLKERAPQVIVIPMLGAVDMNCQVVTKVCSAKSSIAMFRVTGRHASFPVSTDLCLSHGIGCRGAHPTIS